jgi:putative ABC transport system permease protein
MLATVFAGLWARKRRLLGTTTAVVLGVAFLTATLVIGDTMRTGFTGAFERANAGTDVSVRSSVVLGSEPRVRDAIDAAVTDQMADLDGVARAVPVVEGIATIVGTDGDPIGGNGPPTTAGSWIEDPALNPYRIVDGRPPAAEGEVVIDRRAASAGDLQVGDTTQVLVPEPIDVTVVGIAAFGDDDSFGPVTYTAFSFDQAQALLSPRAGTVSEVLVIAEDGVSRESLRDEISELLPARIEALTQAELIAEQEQEIQDDFVGMFELILLAFAGIALVVATFSIHNTFAILVAQRTRESALLRAIGATRRQVLVGVGVEALVVGVIASAIGLAAGFGLAVGLDALLSGAGMSLDQSLVIGVDTIVIAAVVGIGTTLVASIAPALRASRVAPLAALRDVAIDRSGTSLVRALAGTAIAGAGAATVLTATSADGGALGRAGLGALGVVVGTVVLGPVLARPAAAGLGGLAALGRGFTGRLARRNAMRNPRRVAGSAAALMVGTAVVALFATFGSSLKASVDAEVDRAFSGDLVVIQDNFSAAALSTELAPAIEDLPEVAQAVGVAFGVAQIDTPQIDTPQIDTAQTDGTTVEPAVTDPARLAAAFDLGVTSGSIEQLAPGQIGVSEDYATEHGLALGDVVTMTFVDGARADLEVGAVYAERMSFGDLVMTRPDWEPHAGQAGDTVLFVNLADGVGIEDGQRAVDTVTTRFNAPAAQDRDEYVESVGAQIDQMLTVVYGLLGVAVLIALLGIANTLSLSIHERTRELGLLRAVGQSRGQLRATVRWEAVIVAVFGTITGVAIGAFLGWGLVRALQADEGFGQFAAPWTSLVVIVALAAAAGVVAALRPARRAARLDVLTAISTD